MIKLPKDKWGNEGWAVKANKRHVCASCRRPRIEPGDFYYRAIAWPSSDYYTGTSPWVLKICRECLNGERRDQFDVTTARIPGTANQTIEGA